MFMNPAIVTEIKIVTYSAMPSFPRNNIILTLNFIPHSLSHLIAYMYFRGNLWIIAVKQNHHCTVHSSSYLYLIHVSFIYLVELVMIELTDRHKNLSAFKHTTD